MDVSIPMTVLGGLQLRSTASKLGFVLRFNTDDGIRRAAIFCRSGNWTSGIGVSIPMTVLGGLQSEEQEAQEQQAACFNTDDGIRRAAIG